MKRIFGILAALVIIASMFTAPAYAQDGVTPLEPQTPPPSAETGEMVDETPSMWFVELSGAPAADGGSLAAVKAEKAAFRKAAKAAGLKYSERYAFDTLWNGLSVKIEAGELARLSRIPGVKNIYPVETIAMPQEPVEAIEPDLFTALSMTGADVAQSELGFTGKGIKVAVIDTGIDIDHPDFGGDRVADGLPFPTARVVTGWDFVGDGYNSSGKDAALTPVPDPIPDDCGGHGSHVAGIIGANGVVKGVAPDVTFGAYRVFGCAGTTDADIMILAMERALADGMQVLNMSIGSAYQWPQYPTAAAANRLVNKGVVVVASIGNYGANGLYSAGAPGLGEKVIGVASYDNTRVAQAAFSISPDGKLIGLLPATGAPPAPNSSTLPITGSTTDLACPQPKDGHFVNPYAPGSLTGKAVLVSRGSCSFYWKARFAMEAGAAAVIVANNTTGTISMTVEYPPTAAFSPFNCPHPDFPTCPVITIPTISILQVDGAEINTRLASGPVDLTWTNQTISSVNPTGGLISSFSSYGLSPDLTLKPDIGAPGGSIWSTYPLEKGGYASMGGTSMSSPHVAGTVALLLEAKPNTPAQAVRGILQNTAVPKNWGGNPALGVLDNVHRQGAGMVQIDKAILATTGIEPAKLSVGEGEAGPQTFALSLENQAAAPVTYDLSYVNARSTGGVITPSFPLGSDALVTFDADTVTVPAGGTAAVKATITPATYPTNGQYGGYIVFTPQGGGQVYRVPFAGFVGDYQGIQVLVPTANGFPRLGWTPNGANFGFAGAGDTFTLQGFDDPYFLIHFEHQARLFRVDIYAKNGKAWHRAYNVEYMPRNSTPTGFFAFPFGGYTFNGNKAYMVPDGEYYAVLSVLKANGDADNPAHWETWTSPNFFIDRP